MTRRALTFAALMVASFPVPPRSAPLAVPPNKAWMLRYYTLRGAAVDFLVNSPAGLAKGFGGRPVVLKNTTYKVLGDLTVRFSTRFNRPGLSSFIDTKSGGMVAAGDLIGKPFFAGDSNFGAGMFPSPRSSVADLKQILMGDSRWRVAVSNEGTDNKADIGRVMFWRSADAASLLHLAMPEDVESRQVIGLMRFVSGGRLPFGFLLVNHSAKLGGCVELELSDLALPRCVDVRVAVLENNSGHALRVRGFQGGQNRAVGLRLSTSDDHRLSGASGTLGWGKALTLEAGGRLVVPLRIEFSFSDYDFASPNSGDLAMVAKAPRTSEIKRFLGDFNSKWKKLEFDLTEGPADVRRRGKTATIRYSTLTALAKRAWRDPHVDQDFIYGPSYSLRAVDVDSGLSSAGRRKSQSLDYTTASGFGSCPFISVWDGDKALWLECGRVLIGAAGPGAQRADTYNLPTTPWKIAITEKEAEETHLTRLYLEVDGTRISPTSPAVAVIVEGERRVFQFNVPKELRGHPARLHLSGYYLRRPRISLKPS